MITLTMTTTCSDFEPLTFTGTAATFNAAAIALLKQFDKTCGLIEFPALYEALGDLANGDGEFRHYDMSNPEDAFIMTRSGEAEEQKTGSVFALAFTPTTREFAFE